MPTTDEHDEYTDEYEDEPRDGRPHLVALIRQVPDLITRLIRDEVRATRAELVAKATSAGLGIGLLVGAAIFAFFVLGVLIAAAVIALAGVLPGWLASLLVAAGLLVVAAVFVLIGVRTLKKGAPKEVGDPAKEDIHTAKETVTDD
jgi:uncharacterized membrane protein YdbT with pleckstrin-like domain